MHRFLLRSVVLIGCLAAFLPALVGLHAQDSGLVLTLDDQQNLAGVRCPAVAALQPDGAVLWVVLETCGGGDKAITAFDPATGALLDESIYPSIPIEGFDYQVWEIDPYQNALGFTPDGKLELTLGAWETDEFARLLVDPATGEVTQDEAADTALYELVGQYTEYRIYSTVFSHDRQTAVVLDDTDTPSLHVLDLATGNVLFEIPNALGSISAFSPDDTRLYVNTINEPDNYENWESTLSVYSLPGGELLQQAPASFGGTFPSPDGRFVAYEIASNEAGQEQLAVVNVETGAHSNQLPIHEGAHRLLACANDGRDMSDLDFTVSGMQRITVLVWRPDNSGFMTLNSPGGQFTNTGCQFDLGRVRQYGVNG